MSFVQSSSFKPKTQDRIIGLILFVAVSITIYSIYIVKSKQISLEEWPFYFATLSQSNGIEVNASVKLSGVEIGNIIEVKLQKDTTVRLKLILNPKYADFYTMNSFLKIDRELAINTVLEGGSLIFYSGNSSEIMKVGGFFDIIEPQTISSIIDGLQPEEVANNAKDLVSNLQLITLAVKQNNDQIDTILKNLGSISNELKIVSDKLPALVDNLNSSNQSVQKGINRFNNSIDSVKKPLNDFFINADQLAVNSNKRIKQIEPTIKQLNQLLASLDQTSQSVTQLSNKLSNNWLLASQEKKSEPAPIILIEERSLYDDSVISTSNNN